MTTLVTALMDVGRAALAPGERRSLATYLEWMRFLLSLGTPLVVFADPRVCAHIRSERGNLPGRVIPFGSNELDLTRIRHVLADPDFLKGRPRPQRPELNLPLYNGLTFQKLEFLRRVAIENPFGSRFFLWVDAGYGHGRELTAPYRGTDWPDHPEVLSDDRLHILQVHPVPRCSEEERYRRHRVILATGCFGGTARAVTRAADGYRAELERTLGQGLMDDDQAVMGSLYLAHPEWFRCVGPTSGRYFEMLAYLSGRPIRRSWKGWLQDHPWAIGLAAAGLGLAGLAWSRSRDRSSPAFQQLYQKAMTDVCEVLDESRAPYWFTEGTLIALLRYGRNQPVVDDDIDVMVETPDHATWMELSRRLQGQLARRGWRGGPPYSTFRRRGARPDKLQCWLYASDGRRTHVDIHNYILQPGAAVAYSHGHPDSFPFQRWGGYLPAELIHPLKRCRCYHRSVACPASPHAILRGWNGGEYGSGSLAYPPGGRGPGLDAAIRESAARLREAGYCSMWEEL